MALALFPFAIKKVNQRMKVVRWFCNPLWIIRVLMFSMATNISFATIANSKIEPVVVLEDVVPPMISYQQGVFAAVQADWVFSGIVMNESGEQYHYFFQMRHNKEQFYADAVLVNAQTNALILYETSEALIKKQEDLQWQVGRIFLRFNTINNSWVFGVKHHDNKGFNFKIDMLGQADGSSAKEQDLRTGLELLIGQTGNLNGHLETGDHEEFVTAKKAWFRQMWVSKPQLSSHPFTAILCDFNDGAGFYAVSLHGNDTLRGSIAGWRDEAGTALPMSQFVTAQHEKSGTWHIRVPFPNMLFTLKDSLHQTEDSLHLAAGEIDGKKPGFCVITQYELLADISPVLTLSAKKDEKGNPAGERITPIRGVQINTLST